MENNGISLHPVRELFRWKHYSGQNYSDIVGDMGVWIPLMAIIYSLPLALPISAVRG